MIRRTTMVLAVCNGGHYVIALAGESDWVRNVRAAEDAYHGSAPWCTPQPAGVTRHDRAAIGYYGYNDMPTEYSQRLMAWTGGSMKPHPSIRWALDLLPHSPQQAIDAITGYLNVYRALRPEGRSRGLLDATAIIRARWIDNLVAGTEALFRISPRELEVLVAALYHELGYTVELTPPSRDGGRDVIAVRESPGQREKVEIECKTHSSPVGVTYIRQLRGAIQRSGANRGILVAIGRFTRGAIEESKDDSRLELIDGIALIRMLNANFGSLWAEDRAWICRGLT